MVALYVIFTSKQRAPPILLRHSNFQYYSEQHLSFSWEVKYI